MIKIIFGFELGHWLSFVKFGTCTLEVMYFTPFSDIAQSLKLIEIDFIPSLKFQSEKLLKTVDTSNETQGDDLQFYVIVSQFNEELQILSRLLTMILFPAIRKSLDKKQEPPALHGFHVIRKIHKRQQISISKLREICNQYTVEHDWKEHKQLHCHNSYQLEAAFLKYLNFFESQVLFKLENAKSNTENDHD
jgi:hypothetical protein